MQSCVSAGQPRYPRTRRSPQLRNAGIAALINPPTNAKSSYQVADTHPADPDAWAAAACTERGSWWPDFVGWLKQRGGEQVTPPEGAPALDAAPGRYVLET